MHPIKQHRLAPTNILVLTETNNLEPLQDYIPIDIIHKKNILKFQIGKKGHHDRTYDIHSLG